MCIREMAVADLIELPSADSKRNRGKYSPVRESIEEIDIEVQCLYYEALKDSMLAGEYPPVHVCSIEEARVIYKLNITGDYPADQLFMGNGHHRLTMAHYLGWETIKVTDDVTESGIDFESF